MFRSVLIILRELVNINKVFIKRTWVITYIKIYAQEVRRYYKIRL